MRAFLYQAPGAKVADELSPGSLFDAHGARVERWVRRLAGPGFDVEDTVQEIFLQAFRQVPNFRGDAKASTWLFAITERVVYRRLRHERRRRFFSQLFQHDNEALVGSATPASVLERKEKVALLYAALERIPPKYRTVLMLYELEGLPGDEVASLTEISVDAVWARLHRGRQMLAKALNLLETKAEFSSHRTVGLEAKR